MKPLRIQVRLHLISEAVRTKASVGGDHSEWAWLLKTGQTFFCSLTSSNVCGPGRHTRDGGGDPQLRRHTGKVDDVDRHGERRLHLASAREQAADRRLLDVVTLAAEARHPLAEVLRHR